MNLLSELYSGFVYVNRAGPSFKWYISNREDIINIIEYFKKYPPKTEKLKRLNLIPEFYELKDLKAHKSLPDTPCLRFILMGYESNIPKGIFLEQR